MAISITGLNCTTISRPNYIWSLEACCLSGRLPWARRLWQHLLLYVLNDCGRFVYRQGDEELFGASAVEYGQLLFLACRYADPLAADTWPEEYWRKLCGMGSILLSIARPCGEFGSLVLLRMCAEADTNTRVHVYLNNNLWAIRGLEALASLSGSTKAPAIPTAFGHMAAVLRSSIQTLAAECTAATPTAPWFLSGSATPPFPIPQHLQRTPRSPLPPEQLQAYLIRSSERSQGSAQTSPKTPMPTTATTPRPCPPCFGTRTSPGHPRRPRGPWAANASA